MPFSYHRPTGRICEICQNETTKEPVVSAYNGRASSANSFPVHNWYNFVLGYSPEFPQYIIKRFGITPRDTVLDPFMGSGTTLVECKLREIPSVGIDANDFMITAAASKLNWSVNTDDMRREQDRLIVFLRQKLSQDVSVDFERPLLLSERYMSDDAFYQASTIAAGIEEYVAPELRGMFDFALDAILVSISNVKFSPAMGIVKVKKHRPVLDLYAEKLEKIISDIECLTPAQKNTGSKTYLEDSREMSKVIENGSIDYIITSPPYPGDHEYTKYTKVEMLFRDRAKTVQDFQKTKRRMIRGSTTNIYKDDTDHLYVQDFSSISQIASLIQQRLIEDNATSGFERLYPNLVWQYFGGMARALDCCFKALKTGGKAAFLVSDSHSFKMVHISTASILKEIAVAIGFKADIILWQYKRSTSHRYKIPENILILEK